MPLQATSGAASYDAFGGGVAAVPNYIEDVFSTWLYTGNSSTQAINNGVDLAGKGGLVWIKGRTVNNDHFLFDTSRGANFELNSNTTESSTAISNSVTSFDAAGFTLGTSGAVNNNSNPFVSWTFRKQPKFFDVVTYTGTGSVRTVAHNLGSVPGCIIVKAYSGTNAGLENWTVYHRSLGGTKALRLNTTGAELVADSFWNDTDPTATVFTVADNGAVNGNGLSYVAYLFAHNAGGFGLSGTDNVISCGSYTGNGSATGPTVTLGYEPQWVLVKRADSTSNWTLSDNMRGQPVDGATAILNPNLSDAEASATTAVSPTATGFQVKTSGATYNASGGTYIYIAIRRGPMKVPTTGTSVFSPIAASSGTQTTGFPVDMQILSYRAGTDPLLNHQVIDRLRGVSSTSTADGNYLNTSSNAAQSNAAPLSSILMSNTGFQVGNNYAGASSVFQSFRRAPGFFDVVCYTGNGSNPRTINHNLGVAPELMIFKRRNGVEDWSVYCAYMSSPVSSVLFLNLTDAQDSGTGRWNNTAPTSTVFSLGGINQNTATYVAYLFASCPGVSKVFNYTGNGSSQTINCGFTGGARFVLIKRTDSTGDWYVWDSARGIVSGNDPRLSLNSTAAEVTTDDSVDTDSTGFVVNQLSATNINVSSATYIGIAIA